MTVRKERAVVKHPELPILLVDDEEQFLLSVGVTLSSQGYTNYIKCADSRTVMDILAAQSVSIILLDMTMPHISGRELLGRIVREYPHLPVIVVTAVNEVETAVACMKNGSFDYIVKPVDESRLVAAITRALELLQVRRENTRLKETLLSGKLENPEVFRDIITHSTSMRSIFQYIEAIAATPLPVLVTGETGTGKELFARAIHKASERTGRFVAVNVAGIDDHLFSDTLFGHSKGAFTGADQERKGLILQAADGTLFLDEIGDLAVESQVKLLRLIQEKQYFPLGADVPRLSDARIIVATHQDLQELQNSGHFRKDLFYRLKAHHVHIPPLRERKEDIPLLVNHFLEKAARVLNKKKPTPPPELYILLKNFSYPGNVRELEGMIFDATSRHKSGVLSTSTFREQFDMSDATEMFLPVGSNTPGTTTVIFPDPLPTLKNMEKLLIEEALKRAGGNQTIAAQLLGMTRRALNNRLQRDNG